MQRYVAKQLEWDTNFFGIKSARIDFLSDIEETDYTEIIKFCRPFAFVTLVNKNNINSVNDFIGKYTAAQLKDVNISFKKDLTSYQYGAINHGDIRINNFQKTDMRLVEMAAYSFKYSRFFNDSNLDREKAKQVYSQWVLSSFNKGNKYFLVYGREVPKGFIVFSIQDEHCLLELVAVSPDCQGAGVGTAMMRGLDYFCVTKELQTISVGTQLNNIPAIQFYTKQNFAYQGNATVYHWWKGE